MMKVKRSRPAACGYPSAVALDQQQIPFFDEAKLVAPLHDLATGAGRRALGRSTDATKAAV
jgi:hypothetical protein